MKKILLIILSLLVLVGCNKDNKPFSLDSEYYNDGKIIDIDSNGIKKLEKEKKSFAVFVNLKGCTSCIEFKKVLDQFMDEYKIDFYSLSVNDIEGTCIDDCVKYSPSVVIYHKGKVVASLDAIKNEDLPYYESVEGFKSWFNKYVILEESNN